MLTFPDPNVETEYTDPNGSVWEFNGTGWVRHGDSSGGGDGGDGMWPSFPKPSIDIIALPSGAVNFNSVRAVDFLKVEPDGSLTNYYRHENTQTMNTVAFANTRPLVAIMGNSSSLIEIYDYSTSPFQLVTSIANPSSVNEQRNFCFSASDEYIFCFNRKEAWSHRESSPGSNDWSLYSPVTKIISDEAVNEYAEKMDISESDRANITTQNMNSVTSFPHWTGSAEPYFCATINAKATGEANGPYSSVFLKATASGVELVDGHRIAGYRTGIGSVGMEIVNVSEGHPHIPAALYSGSGLETTDFIAGWTAGLLYFPRYQCASISKIAPPRHRDGVAQGVGFSPSGNYAFVKQKDSYLNFYRVHIDGYMEYKGQIDYQTVTSEGATHPAYGGTWSADEKFFYVFTRQAVTPTGDQGIVLAYSFEEGETALIGKAAEIRSYEANWCQPSRSKF